MTEKKHPGTKTRKQIIQICMRRTREGETARKTSIHTSHSLQERLDIKKRQHRLEKLKDINTQDSHTYQDREKERQTKKERKTFIHSFHMVSGRKRHTG